VRGSDFGRPAEWIPAFAGMTATRGWIPAFGGNDCGLERPSLANDATTPARLAGAPPRWEPPQAGLHRARTWPTPPAMWD